jgi:3-methylcrotonyl-CoA carboxylase beta subunit
MPVLRSTVSPASDAFRANADRMGALVADIREKAATVELGGPEEARARHTSRGKLLPRERLARLLDPGSPFLEIGQFAAFGMYGEDIASAGMIAGIGRVEGREAMVVVNDATVKGGTYYPLTVKKQIRAQQVARENALPCVYLVDSGGAFLPHQEDIFPDAHHFGAIFRNIAEMSALGLPQIAAVMGSCTAGGAYIPAMADETVIVRGTGTIFLGGPQLVQAATGVVVEAETLGGADVHTRRSAVADHLAEDDVEALFLVRAILARAPAPPLPGPDLPPEPPLSPASEIAGLIPASPRQRLPAREILARLIDGGRLDEYRARYARTIICGTAAIEGYRVGILMPTTACSISESALKGAHFIELCCQRENAPGVPAEHQRLHGGPRNTRRAASPQGRREAGECGRHCSGAEGHDDHRRLYGAGNYGMCGRAYSPRFLWMWPNTRISVMGGEQAATVLSLVKREGIERRGGTWSAEEEAAFRAPILEKYEREGHPLYSSARLWDDGIIDPAKSREVLSLSLSAALNAPIPQTRFGMFRM